MLLACGVFHDEPLHDVLDAAAMTLGASDMLGRLESILSDENTISEQATGEGPAVVCRPRLW